MNGIDRVLEQFDDAYATRAWLTTLKPALDNRVPLDFLRMGDVELVIKLATGDAQGDFA